MSASLTSFLASMRARQRLSACAAAALLSQSSRARQRLAAISVLLFAFLVSPASAAPTVHPAIWHVKGAHGDVTLFGSIHLLPPDIAWRTPAVIRAMKRADVFVFEVPTDAQAKVRVQALVAARGLLPQGQTLSGLLPPDAKADYEAELAADHLPEAVTDKERPWLVDLQILVAQTMQLHYSQDAGVDHVVMGLAEAAHKELRYLETIDQQFALLAPQDDTLELQEFEADLKDFRKRNGDIGALVAAWSQGDVPAIDRLMNGALQSYPDARKALLTDRNGKWVLQIETMLQEKRRFFITVGAGHLAGPDGVPALLRKAGYAVDGP